jgi:hypothetical protein
LPRLLPHASKAPEAVGRVSRRSVSRRRDGRFCSLSAIVQSASSVDTVCSGHRPRALECSDAAAFPAGRERRRSTLRLGCVRGSSTHAPASCRHVLAPGF